MLHRFDLPELQRQQQVLGALEEHMKCHQGQTPSLTQSQELVSAEGADLLPPRPVDRTMANKMRNRRATLRKQRLRVEDRISQLMNTNNNVVSDTDVSANPNPNPVLNSTTRHNTTTIHNSDDNIVADCDINNTTQYSDITTKSSIPHHPHLVSLDDPLANPKTRLGWGFWQN